MYHGACRGIWLLMLLPVILGLVVILSAERVLSDSDFIENVYTNPCDNFYAYICESQFKTRDGSVSNFKSLVSEAQDNVVAKLKAVLEDDDMEDDFPMETARTFYASCMNTDQIERDGIKPIQWILEEFGGWPLIASYLKNKNLPNWQNLHAYYNKINVFPLYEISVNYDSLRRIGTVSVRQPKTIVREPFLYKAESFLKYVEYIKTVAMIVAKVSGSDVSVEEIREEATQIVSFEAELSKILEQSERLNLYQPIILQKFQQITNQAVHDKDNELDWVKIINEVYFTSSKKITAQDLIEVSTFSYFPRLIQLLDRTPLRIIINYIHWRFVHQYLPHTASESRNLYFGMRDFIHEPMKNTSRWRFCGFEPALDHVLSYSFAEKFITPEIEKMVDHVLRDIKKVTIDTIKGSTLLNDHEKRIAEIKILKMTFVLGIPEPLKNLSLINSYYKELSLSDDYFNNVLALRSFYKVKELEIINENNFQSSENNNFMRISTISSIGSAYEFFENSVLIKAENLLPPLLDTDFPEHKKYGMLGFTIAYEIMQAFNDADSIGSLKPRRHLYSDETKLKYWDKMECLINQFDNYYIPDPFDSEKHVYVDGERSAVENIADSAAIQIAFRAFRERSRAEKFSSNEDNEDFFASFASLLCRPELEEFYLSRFNLALRTLPRFRVIGALSNTNEFAEAFSCSSGTRMNPETKCNFWN